MPQQALTAVELAADDDAQLADVMLSVRAELTRLAHLAEEMQHSFGEALIAAARGRPDILEKAQGLDALAQHLTGVADFLGALGPQLPDHWALDPAPALRVVLLSDLAARLAGQAHAPAAAPDDDCEFF
jgi:hypothetical protein